MPPTPTNADSTPLHDELRALLREFLAQHETLLGLTTEHHEAIRQADPLRCERVMQAERNTLASIAELESRRQNLVRRAQTEIRPAQAVARLSDLARCAPEGERAGLIEMAERLRGLVARVQEEQNIVRVVSRVLLAHMEGLMRQVARSLSHAGTYARSGAVAAGSPIVTSLDVRL
ncbi:MAG: flagellar export chaperone FlgN [Phycisphaerae bacterium]|nr:flagellar export chaperone FlgN [Phycisphaerae bacterium]MBN8597344.1 flagellar export chaperone FlgN [Planctomycetota bacterium]